MCSTCNYENFIAAIVNGSVKLQAQLGVGNLMIRCDPIGKNWRLGVADNERDEFVLYSCPTCGRHLG